MIVYAESSAILAALLGESSREQVQDVMNRADRVFASVLTSVECSRGIIRAQRSDRLTPVEALAVAKALDEAERRWLTVQIDDRITARAREPFPFDPVRSLDAMHLATALVLQESLGVAVHVLTLDDRVCSNALALGLRLAVEP